MNLRASIADYVLKRHSRAGDEMAFTEERVGDERERGLAGATTADVCVPRKPGGAAITSKLSG